MALGISKVTGTLLSGSVAGGSSTPTWGTALNAAAGERFDNLLVQVKIEFGSGSSGDAVIHRRKSADDGTTLTNTGTAILTVTNDTVTPPIVEFELAGGDYVEIGVENEDASVALTATVTYEGTKITGLS